MMFFLRIGSILTVSLGLAAIAYLLLSSSNSPLHRLFSKYRKELDRLRSFLFIRMSANRILYIQISFTLAMFAIAFLTGNVGFAIAAVGALVGPILYLKRKSSDKVLELEDQLDGWLLLLSNALKASPAIGEAMRSTIALVQSPFSEEVDLIVKETQLGTPLDQAILGASDRIGSPMVSGALSTILIARQTGGNLSEILETTAASLRERQRLEGVVRTKTAEVKGQLVVLAIVPAVLVLGLSLIHPGWFDPLIESTIGYVILGACSLLWVTAILWANQILDLDV